MLGYRSIVQGIGVNAVVAWLRRLFVGGLVLALLLVNFRLYSPVSIPADHGAIESNLRFIDRSIDDGLASDMQQLFPEGYFFTHVLYGLTWVEVGLQGDANNEVKTKALAEARTALEALDSPAGRAPFSSTLDPPYGGFYVGWSNYLRAGIVALQASGSGVEVDGAELEVLAAECDVILDALDRTGSPFLESYPGETWPVDTYPAMVSVKACAEFVDGKYERDLDAWFVGVDAERDANHGLVGHRTEPFREHPRATSQTLILRFLAELDPERSAEAYEQFRQDFVVSRLGLPAVREHPKGIDAGGDVDSGPLITGVSLSSTVVAIGAAQVHGDHDLASALRKGGRAFGFPLPLPGGERYSAGMLPIGDLFVVWSSSAHLWFQPEPPSNDAGPGWAWRLPTHLISFTIGFGAWFAMWPGTRARAAQLWGRLKQGSGGELGP